MTRARNKTKAGRWKKMIIVINFVFIFLLLLTYITPLISVQKWGWLSLLALAYPFTLFINGLFAIGWIFFRSWLSMYSIVAILLGWTHHSKYIQLFPAGNGKLACEESIRILSYNMRGMSLIPVKKNDGIQVRIDSIYNALTDLKEFPDLICLQEATKGDLIAKKFGLKHSYHGPKSTLWLLSRYPIEKSGSLEGAEKGPSAIWADIKTPQGMLRVYNMHLVSNRVTNTTEELIQDMDLQDRSTWNNFKFILSRYKATTKKRAIEARTLRAHMSGSKHPVIVAGDVNDPPLSNTYHIISKDLHDSFRRKGFGLSTTYGSKLPLLRIDYLFGTKDIQFKDHTTYHIGYSDHFPISTGICISHNKGS